MIRTVRVRVPCGGTRFETVRVSDRLRPLVNAAILRHCGLGRTACVEWGVRSRQPTGSLGLSRKRAPRGRQGCEQCGRGAGPAGAPYVTGCKDPNCFLIKRRGKPLNTDAPRPNDLATISCRAGPTRHLHARSRRPMTSPNSPSESLNSCPTSTSTRSGKRPPRPRGEPCSTSTSRRCRSRATTSRSRCEEPRKST